MVNISINRAINVLYFSSINLLNMYIY